MNERVCIQNASDFANELFALANTDANIPPPLLLLVLVVAEVLSEPSAPEPYE